MDARIGKRIIAAIAVWTAVVGGGLASIHRYGATPGAATEASPVWPGEGIVARKSDRLTMVVFCHPLCPCSRATLSILANLVDGATTPVDCHVFMYRPNDGGPGWSSGDSWSIAERIRGATMRSDVDGRTAKAFGARTSGHVMIYDRQGSLAYSGGVTAVRGESGPNPGAAAVRSLLLGRPSATGTGPVFGCPIVEVDSSEASASE